MSLDIDGSGSFVADVTLHALRSNHLIFSNCAGCITILTTTEICVTTERCYLHRCLSATSDCTAENILSTHARLARCNFDFKLLTFSRRNGHKG